MSIRFLQPVISTTGIRYILDNEGRQIATVNGLEDGIDNKARAKESEYIHNEICYRFNELAALRAENAKLREVLENLLKNPKPTPSNDFGKLQAASARYVTAVEEAKFILESYNE